MNPMTPSEVAVSYDRLAGHWAGEAFNQENGIAAHHRALQFLDGPGSAIDIGCGSSGRILDLLIRRGFEVEGLDFSAGMLRLARQRHPQVSFYHADICEWGFSKQYDFISAWDSVWHVPLSQQATVHEKLCAGLAPGGVLLFTSGGLDEPGEVFNPCLGQPMYHATLGIPKLQTIVAESGCVCRHLEYDQYPETHLVWVVQRRD